MSGRTIAIGDIHGCSEALETLLRAIALDSDDLIVTLGDYVDRGPDSRGVIDQLLVLESAGLLVPLVGNHELMFLAVERGDLPVEVWKHCGGRETLDSYGGQIEQVPVEHIEFIRRCRRFHETSDFLFLHANYDPDLEVEDQVDELLFWEHIGFTMPGPHRSGKTAIVGHTPQIDGDILDLGHLICIDTCCFGGGWLSALDVETRQLWQVNMAGQIRVEPAASEQEP